MVALNFPDAPTIGQIYDKWTWDGATWKLTGGGGSGGSGFTFSQDATPTANRVGDTWFETDTGSSYVWTNDGNSTQWVQFATTGGTSAGGARGRVAYAQITANVTGISGAAIDVAGLSVTWVADPARRYLVSAHLELNSSVNGDNVALYLTDGGGTATCRAAGCVPNAGFPITLKASVPQIGLSGTITRKVQAARTTGTGAVTAIADPRYPSYLLVEDIGT